MDIPAIVFWPDLHVVELLGITIRLYSLFFFLGLLASGGAMYYFYKRERAPVQEFLPVFFSIVLLSIIGARLVHVLFYDLEYYLQHPLEVLMIWKGGLSSHGGFAGAFLAVYLFSRFFGKIYYWWYYDRLGVAMPLAGAFIRIGNLMNSELVGRPTDVPWAFQFGALGESFGRHPVVLYEAIALLLIFVIMWFLYLRVYRSPKFGILAGAFLVLHTSSRFMIEFFKDRPQLEMGLSMEQLLTLPLLLIGLLVLGLALKGKIT